MHFEGGLEVGAWYRAFRHTHDNKRRRIEWPDGECYAEQSLVQIEMWELIEDEWRVMERKNVKPH
jgi:hypothetical protein